MMKYNGMDDQAYGHFYDTDVIVPLRKTMYVQGNRIYIQQFPETDIPYSKKFVITNGEIMNKETSEPCGTNAVQCISNEPSETYSMKDKPLNAKTFICVVGIVTVGIVLFECWVFYGLGI